MQSLSRFLHNFFRYPREMGALFATSSFYSKLACKQVDWGNIKYIAELGAGDGAVTKYIVQNLKSDQKLLVFEKNDDLFAVLQQHFGHLDNVVLIHDSAELLDQYAQQNHVPAFDAIFSEVPLVSLPPAVTANILQAIKTTLHVHGLCVQISYSLFSLKKLRNTFASVQIKFTPFNLPPAFLYLIRTT